MDASDPVYAAAVVAAQAEADAAEEEFASAEARQRRSESRTKFAALSDSDAVALIRSAFPDFMTGPTEVNELALPAGAEIGEFTSPFTAQVVTPDGEPAGLLESSAALTTDGSAETAIDLSLELDGDDYVADSPRVDVELPVEATDPAVLADGKITVRPVGADASSAIPRSDRLIYPSIDTDTDYVLRPVEQGIESLWQLRSAASPETLRLDYDIPTGAQLQIRPAPGSGDAVAIVKDGRTIGTVRPVSAMDAAGRPVPADMAIDGEGIVVSVDHRTDAVQYPVLVDPVTESWTTAEFTSCGANSAGGGWGSPSVSGGRPFWTICDYNSYGLLLGSHHGTQYFQNDAANWSYFARPNTYISDITWGGWSHGNVYGTEGYVGLSSLSPLAWQKLDMSFYGRSAANLSQQQGPKLQNYATLGLRFHTTVPSQGGYTGVQWVAMFIKDGGPPTINQVYHENGSSTQTSDEIWDMPWSSAPKLRVRAQDVGLGINSVSVVGQNGKYLWGPHWYGGNGSITSASNVCRGTRVSQCPQNVDTPMLTGNVANLSEGDNVGWVVVQDASGEQAWGQKIHMRLDRTAPGLPNSLQSIYYSDDGTADVTWNAANDVISGTDAYRYRYRRGASAWTGWNTVFGATVGLQNSFEGESLSFELQALDKAGNLGPSVALSATSRATVVSPSSMADPDQNRGDADADPATDSGPDPASYVPPATNPAEHEQDLSRAGDAYTEMLCGYGSNPGSGTNPCGSYDRQAAANYAHRNWDERPAAFPDFNNDCTNFVSQAVHSGGMRFMRTGGVNTPDAGTVDPPNIDVPDYRQGPGAWWTKFTRRSPGPTGSAAGYSYAWALSWSVADISRSHLLNYNLARGVGRFENVKPGDIVYYKLVGLDRGYSHAAIVSRVTRGHVIVAQHTSDYEKKFAKVATSLNQSLGRGNWLFDVVRPKYTKANIL